MTDGPADNLIAVAQRIKNLGDDLLGQKTNMCGGLLPLHQVKGGGKAAPPAGLHLHVPHQLGDGLVRHAGEGARAAGWPARRV
jgi:hypothetical protein